MGAVRGFERAAGICWLRFSEHRAEQSVSMRQMLDGRCLTNCSQLLSVDQWHGTVHLWHCVQVTSRRRLSEDI